jgi:Flp pilus assembly protein CpaB
MRAIRSRRRWIAAVLVAGAVAFGLEAVAPPPAPVTQIVVAANDLSPGTMLSGNDLRLVDWPVALAPDTAATSITELVGHTLAAGLSRGEPVTRMRLVGPTLASAVLESGRVATPVRLADPTVAALLHPGDRVDLVAAQAGSSDPVSGGTAPADARVVAPAALVLSVVQPDQAGSVLVGGATTASGLLVVAVSRTEALGLARASLLGPLSVLLVG